MNTSIRFLCFFSVIGFAALPLSLAAQSVFLDFNSPVASFADNLTKGVSSSESLGDFVQSSGTGLKVGAVGTDSAYVPDPTSDNFSYTTNTVFDGAFTSSTMSTYVKVKDLELTGTALSLTMGFNSLAIVDTGTGSPVGVPTATPTAGGSQSSFAINLRGAASASGASDGLNDNYNFSSYNNGAYVTQGSTATLTIGNWYYWETNILRAGDGYTINAQLFASDDQGTITGSALINYDVVLANASLSAESNIYGYISSQNGSRRGVERLDDLSFSAIPEPSTYTALLGFAALLIVGCRRFKS